jgi:hypothetical protein
MRKGRHRVCAALVETGIDEGHRDDAQERVAISGDGSGLVECVGLHGGHGATVGGGDGAVDKSLIKERSGINVDPTNMLG